jgi:AcrR family transcriptional regulator
MAEEPGPPLGLRERKKLETRNAILRAAMELFTAHGFDNVSIAQVAEAANVSKVTVFNYFPTKEDLVFVPIVEKTDEVGRSVRQRARGASVLDALREEFLRDLALRRPQLGLAAEGLEFMQVVRDSPSLLARAALAERQQEQQLATVLAEETGRAPSDMVPRVAAAAVLGAIRAVVTENWRRLLLGDPAESIYSDAVAHADQAFELLRTGLGDYGA